MRLAISILLILLLSTTAAAQSIYHYTIIQLDGEYKLTSITGGEIFKVEGVGKAYLERTYIQTVEESPNWWDLF